MLFVLSKVFWIFAAPVNLALLLCLAGVVLLWTRWARAGRWLVSTAIVGLLAVAVLPLGGWLAGTLEARFPPQPEGPGGVEGIIVLGGSTSPSLTDARGQPAVNGAAERLIAFAELARRYPDAKLVFTGGTGSLRPGRLREADVAAQVLQAMGVDISRVLFEREARNTFENGAYAKALADPAPGENWLLVTSAMYMPRAVGVFREAGWPVTPYPVDYVTGGKGGFDLGFNLTRRGESMHRALREWIGLVAYRLLGRTGAVFPAPDGS